MLNIKLNLIKNQRVNYKLKFIFKHYFNKYEQLTYNANDTFTLNLSLREKINHKLK
ncbi:hypothetical protein PROTEUSMB838_13890 [Proteus sp. MB838]